MPYPFHKVVERVEGKVEVERLHRLDEPLRVQIGPFEARTQRSVSGEKINKYKPLGIM